MARRYNGISEYRSLAARSPSHGAGVPGGLGAANLANHAAKQAENSFD